MERQRERERDRERERERERERQKKRICLHASTKNVRNREIFSTFVNKIGRTK